MENFNTVPSTGKYGDSIAVVNENFMLAQQEMEILRNLISPDTKFVTAVATAQTTSVTQVLPETGSADTVYRVGSWDGSQYDPSVYSEYAWNGSAYIKLNTKSQAGEVYDISANHSGAKYADLAAALGTNGANIPQSLRKGGMSVKFVQSSDNKYVQYRFMLSAFNNAQFINPANWQGIEDEPVSNSKNIVDSGCIYELEYLNNARFGNYLINNTSSLVGTSAEYKYIGADVKTRKKVIIKGFTIYTKAAGSVRIISYDKSQDSITNIETSDIVSLVNGMNTITNLNFVVEEGRYIGIENYSGTNGLISNYGNSTNSPEIKTIFEYYNSEYTRIYRINNNCVSLVYDIQDYYEYLCELGNVDYHPIIPFTIKGVAPNGQIYTPSDRSACYIIINEDLYKEEINAVNVYCAKNGSVTICKGTHVAESSFVETNLITSSVIKGWNRIVLKEPIVLNQANNESIGVRGTDATIYYWMDGQVGFMQKRTDGWRTVNQTIGLIPLCISNAPLLNAAKSCIKNIEDIKIKLGKLDGEILNTKYGDFLIKNKDNLVSTDTRFTHILSSKQTAAEIIIKGLKCFSKTKSEQNVKLFYSSAKNVTTIVESDNILIKPGFNLIDNINFTVPIGSYIGITNPSSGCVPHLGGTNGHNAGIPASETWCFFESDGTLFDEINYCSIPFVFYEENNSNSLLPVIKNLYRYDLGYNYNPNIGNVDFQQIGDTDYNHIAMYGQSLSVGSNANMKLTNTVIPGNYMLGSNVGDFYGDNTNTIDVSTKIFQGLCCGDKYENSIIGLVNSLSQISRRHLGKDIRFLATSSGYGARTIAQLSKPSRYAESGIAYNRYDSDTHTVKHYEAFEAQMTRAKQLADAEGKTIALNAIVFMQGEQDYADTVVNSTGSNLSCEGSKALYKERLIELKNDMQSSAMTIYGQTKKPLFFIAPVGGNFVSKWDMGINMAQIELALENDDIFLLNPTYPVPDFGSNSHLTSNGYRWWGLLAAKSIVNAFVNEERTMPIIPFDYKVYDNVIYISCFAKQMPIKINTWTVEAKTNFGFRVKDSNGYNEILAVSVMNGTIVLQCQRNLTGTVEITYAGSTRNGCGNICDSDRWSSMYSYIEDTDDEVSGRTIGYRPHDENGNIIYDKDYPMQNWLVNFYYKLTV